MTFDLSACATIAIAAFATAGVIVRPRGIPEAVWAVAGAILLVVFHLISFSGAARAVGRGLDVYLFLTGMMLLSELAQREGLFATLAARTARLAGGSPKRLFLLTYGVGTVITIFMSNDATAVVLTPAVLTAAQAAEADALPLAFSCAFIANAASFVLPISNPANLVLFDRHIPALGEWLARFGLPSAVSILVTLALLFLTQRKKLRGDIRKDIEIPPLGRTGVAAGCGIVATAIILMASSALGAPLGWPTFIAGMVTAITILLMKRETPRAMLREIHWSILPLVAGLFVLVEGLRQTGAIDWLTGAANAAAKTHPAATGWAGGLGVGFAANLMNNLPAGLIAGNVVHGGVLPTRVVNALLIGVDLGPNLSVTGSLATILWLAALRRGGVRVTAWQFLRLGALLMPAALAGALAASMLASG